MSASGWKRREVIPLIPRGFILSYFIQIHRSARRKVTTGAFLASNSKHPCASCVRTRPRLYGYRRGSFSLLSRWLRLLGPRGCVARRAHWTVGEGVHFIIRLVVRLVIRFGGHIHEQFCCARVFEPH